MTANEIKHLAIVEWDSGKLFCDKNRDLIRLIFENSDNYKNLRYFAELISLSEAEIRKIGQLEALSRATREKKRVRAMRRRAGRDTADDRIAQQIVAAEFAKFSHLYRDGGKKTKGGNTVSTAAGQFFGK